MARYSSIISQAPSVTAMPCHLPLGWRQGLCGHRVTFRAIFGGRLNFPINLAQQNKAPLCKGGSRLCRVGDCFTSLTIPPSKSKILPPPFAQGRLYFRLTSSSPIFIQHYSIIIPTRTGGCSHPKGANAKKEVDRNPLLFYSENLILIFLAAFLYRKIYEMHHRIGKQKCK